MLAAACIELGATNMHSFFIVKDKILRRLSTQRCGTGSTKTLECQVSFVASFHFS